MKAESIQEETLPHFLSAFESLTKCNLSIEVHRSLALFITYAFHTSPSSQPRTPKPSSATATRSASPLVPVATRTAQRRYTGELVAPKTLTRKQLGVKILEMYAGLLCDQGGLAEIRKFARAVTNKVSPSARWIDALPQVV